MSRFLSLQCDISDIKFPKWAKKWINVRKCYTNYYQCKRCDLREMLHNLGMEFEGTLHCGLHDSRNIARIALRLMEDGCDLKVNEYIHGRTSTGKSENSEKKKGQNNDDTGHTHNRSCDSDISQSLKALSLNGKTDISEEEDNAEDLLEYYRLQKS